MRHSDLIGIPIVSQQDEKSIAHVTALFLDPETGNLIAIAVSRDKKQIIATSDIIIILPREIQVRNKTVIVPISEVVRAERIQKQGPHFLKNHVYTENNDYLGKVFDLEINKTALSLEKIYLRKTLFMIVQTENTIKKNDIIEITPKKIIVKNDSFLQKKPIKEGKHLASAPV